MHGGMKTEGLLLLSRMYQQAVCLTFVTLMVCGVPVEFLCRSCAVPVLFLAKKTNFSTSFSHIDKPEPNPKQQRHFLHCALIGAVINTNILGY